MSVTFDPTTEKTGMFLRGLRRRTGRPVPELVGLFRSIIDGGRDHHPIASDFLEHFMDGAGGSRTMSQRWLRSFKVIRRAERKNRRRFERQLTRRARLLDDHGSDWLRDHWDARINAFIGTELFYVSRMSLLRSHGSFVLTRDGRQVKVSGTVRHRWFDPYDWDRGRWVYIPRHGFVPIAVGRELVEADEARDFLMEARHVQTLEGVCTWGRWPRRGRATFTWALVRTER
ncbi:hypothetical protein FAF44_15045 [Nonomuraea sp. MG754425]|uniref:hypothetical protein n=1 Tax=Nonomuraea sp. MG754425 TaxID=2570319 RepID=UPI001F368007|nr:hypothetical protein [Nonomuraea sp. MG754425]MCF6469696.1 hypothetical protein [Nonomuraea sp. MG754425]